MDHVTVERMGIYCIHRWNTLDCCKSSRALAHHKLLIYASQVYATLTAAVVLSAVGIATNITFHVGGFLSIILAFGSLTWLAFTPASPQNLVSSATLQH